MYNKTIKTVCNAPMHSPDSSNIKNTIEENMI